MAKEDSKGGIVDGADALKMQAFVRIERRLISAADIALTDEGIVVPLTIEGVEVKLPARRQFEREAAVFHVRRGETVAAEEGKAKMFNRGREVFGAL